MRFFYLSIVTLFALLVASAYGQDGGNFEGFKEFHLTDENWEEATKGKLYFVKFFVPGCGYCKMVEEHWNKLAEITLNEYPNINIASMDCSGAGKETCKKFDIKGYPSLKLVKNGVPTLAYLHIDRGMDALLKWAKKQFPEDLESCNAL